MLTDQNGNKYKINQLIGITAVQNTKGKWPQFYYADVEFNPGARTIRATMPNAAPGSGKLLYTITSGWHP